MAELNSCRETMVGEPIRDGSEELGDLGSLIEEKMVTDPVRDGSEKLGDLGCLVEEEMVKGIVEEGLCGSSVVVGVDGVNNGEMVSVIGRSTESVGTVSVDANGVKSGEVAGGDGYDTRNGQIMGVKGDGMETVENGSDDEERKGEEEEEENSSSSSEEEDSEESSSSSDDDDSEDNEGKEGEENSSSGNDGDDSEDKEEEEDIGNDVKEGNVSDSDVEEMVAWSDAEEDDGDGDGGGGGGADVMSGPIRSKNELKVLPLVPPVTETLQPHHQTLPVGAVLSIIGSQVIVEGVEKHNPLNEGSILWITESRSPLGLIDEIFGPVKNPYYLVRYNSENEIPASIQPGTSISFVPEFANQVLNDSDLHKKGYDASGEYDEEVADKAEFSDDEEEAEYRKKLKTTKRVRNVETQGNMKEVKKFKNSGVPQKTGQPSAPKKPVNVCDLPTDQKQQFEPIAASLDQSRQHSFGQGQVFANCPGIAPPLPQLSHTTGFLAPSNGVWTNGMPFQQQQGMAFHNGFPTNVTPWLQQNHHQTPLYQMPLMYGTPSQQQLGPGQMVPSNVVLLGEQSNFHPGHSSAPWPGPPVQEGFNQISSGMGFRNQFARPPMNVGAQGIVSNSLWNDHSFNLQQPPVVPGNTEASRNFNQGAYRGRKPHHRGGGRFSSGRG